MAKKSRYRNLNDKALHRKYNALKQDKKRNPENAKQLDEMIADAVAELNSRGLNTQGKPLKPQGYGAGTHCICSPAEKMMGRHRPNCPSA